MKRKTWLLIVSFFLIFSTPVQASVPEEVIAVGKAVGIDVQCSGLMVVSFSDDSPAKDSGLHRGDLIIKVDGQPVEDPATLRSLLQNKPQVTLTALRQNQEQNFWVHTRQTGDVSLIGANVRSEMAGIGTITYYDPATAVFGALGHGITDSSTSKLFPVRDGFICKASVTHVEKGTAGTPGVLQGAFDSSVPLGSVTKNTASGIFGTLSAPPDGEFVPVCTRDQVTTGPAEILCNVEGDQVEHFDIKIRRLYPLDDGTGRNMMIEVTDSRLLSITGGIVQGMSGSPILQNGNLVGAVTHVLISDPTTGYGIFIDNMLKTAA